MPRSFLITNNRYKNDDISLPSLVTSSSLVPESSTTLSLVTRSSVGDDVTMHAVSIGQDIEAHEYVNNCPCVKQRQAGITHAGVDAVVRLDTDKVTEQKSVSAQTPSSQPTNRTKVFSHNGLHHDFRHIGSMFCHNENNLGEYRNIESATVNNGDVASQCNTTSAAKAPVSRDEVTNLEHQSAVTIRKLADNDRSKSSQETEGEVMIRPSSFSFSFSSSYSNSQSPSPSPPLLSESDTPNDKERSSIPHDMATPENASHSRYDPSRDACATNVTLSTSLTTNPIATNLLPSLSDRTRRRNVTQHFPRRRNCNEHDRQAKYTGNALPALSPVVSGRSESPMQASEAYVYQNSLFRHENNSVPTNDIQRHSVSASPLRGSGEHQPLVEWVNSARNHAINVDESTIVNNRVMHFKDRPTSPVRVHSEKFISHNCYQRLKSDNATHCGNGLTNVTSVIDYPIRPEIVTDACASPTAKDGSLAWLVGRTFCNRLNSDLNYESKMTLINGFTSAVVDPLAHHFDSSDVSSARHLTPAAAGNNFRNLFNRLTPYQRGDNTVTMPKEENVNCSTMILEFASTYTAQTEAAASPVCERVTIERASLATNNNSPSRPPVHLLTRTTFSPSLTSDRASSSPGSASGGVVPISPSGIDEHASMSSHADTEGTESGIDSGVAGRSAVVGDLMHVCSDCGKAYSTASNLARHRQIHRATDDKKARKCPHCDKLYVSSPAYSMHVRTHNEGCACPHCGKRFSRPWLLQGHIRTHTGDKPFTCNVCEKRFADKSNLRAHVQTHSTARPFVCGRCGKGFALRSYLYKHEESSCMRSHRLLSYQEMSSTSHGSNGGGGSSEEYEGSAGNDKGGNEMDSRLRHLDYQHQSLLLHRQSSSFAPLVF